MNFAAEYFTQLLFVAATLLGAAGLWLMLPRGGAPGRRLGAVLAAASLGVLSTQLPALGPEVRFTEWVFFTLAGVTVVSAALTVTLRKPVYSAIWFALTLLGTASLFLIQGAQFLAVATVVVYAGAILVTFLFVLMLANPEGRAYYDRLSWEAFLSATAGAVMIGILTMTLARAFDPETAMPVSAATAEERAGEILAEQHVAHLGARLFSEHLIAVQVAGALLLVALIGAVAIVSYDETKRQAEGHR